MAERNYWVLCDDGCKFPAMTAEQVLAAIAEATGNTATDIDDAFITKVREMNAGENLKFWVGTTAQFNALETKEGNTLYILSDDDTADSIEESIESLRGELDGIADNISAFREDFSDYKSGIADGTIVAKEADHAGSADTDGDGNTFKETYLHKKEAAHIERRLDIGTHLTTDYADKVYIGGNVFMNGTAVWSINDIVAISLCDYKGRIFNGIKASATEEDDNGTFVRFTCSLVPRGSTTDSFFEIGRVVVKIYEANNCFYLVLEEVSGLSYDFVDQAWTATDAFFATWDTMSALNNAYLFFE